MTIPMASRRIGSWEVHISRRTLPPADLAKRYDFASERWGRTAQRYRLESAYREPLLASQIRAALTHRGPKARVLDCGIGCASLSIALDSILKQPADYYGIDTSVEMLLKAKAKMRHVGLNPCLKQANVLSLPFDDQSFDVIMAAHILEHLPDPKLALKEMVRVLKPGGTAFLCMTRHSFFGALIQLKWRTWAVTEQQGIAWLKECQLTDIACQPVHLGFCAGAASTAFWARRPAEYPL